MLTVNTKYAFSLSCRLSFQTKALKLHLPIVVFLMSLIKMFYFQGFLHFYQLGINIFIHKYVNICAQIIQTSNCKL